MLYYRNGKYNISNTKVHYISKDEGEVVKFVGQEGRQWWEEFAKKWKDTFELKGFNEIDIPHQQLKRLQKVNELNLPDGIPLIDLYVLEGKFINNIDGKIFEIGKSHPLYALRVEEELERIVNSNKKIEFQNKELETKIEIAEQQNKITLMGLMDVNSKLRDLQKEVK